MSLARRILGGLRSLHPATYLASLALVVAVVDVSPADAVRTVKRALFAQDAGSVNGIKASRTPRAGRLLPLGADGKFDASAWPTTVRGPRGSEGPEGPVGVTGPTGPRGPSDARVATPASTQLSRLDGVDVTLASLSNVAAGAYVVTFSSGAHYRVDGHRMYATCEIRVNGVSVASTRGIVGDDPGGSTGSLALTTFAPVNQPGPFQLTATCRPSENALAGQETVSMEKPRLVALRLDSVTTG